MLITGCIKENSLSPAPNRSTLLLKGSDENNTQRVIGVSARNHSKTSTEKSVVHSGSGVKVHDIGQALTVASDNRRRKGSRV
jgi:hypothetical protein